MAIITGGGGGIRTTVFPGGVFFPAPASGVGLPGVVGSGLLPVSMSEYPDLPKGSGTSYLVKRIVVSYQSINSENSGVLAGSPYTNLFPG